MDDWYARQRAQYQATHDRLTDMVTILGEIAETNPIVTGVCNEPVCHYCGLTQFRALPPAHRETCAWVRANALLDAMR